MNQHTISYTFLIGVDEAGRGSWAGPVVAGVYALQKGTIYPFSPLLNDSKKLSPKKRGEIFQMLQESIKQGLCFGGVGIIDSKTIDQVGIREANRLAMQEALKQVLSQVGNRFESLQIDGRDNYRFENIDPASVKYVVRGDTFVPEIQAASILAKVSRDRLMEEFAKTHPEYGFERHKGY